MTIPPDLKAISIMQTNMEGKVPDSLILRANITLGGNTVEENPLLHGTRRDIMTNIE